MKTALFLAAAFCALPIAAHAEKFGDFRPGQTFTRKVVEKSSIRYRLFDKDSVPVPKNLPNFKRGASVRFRIGDEGQLIARKGIRLKFRSGTDGRNYYGSADRAIPRGDGAEVSKTNSGKPRSVSLYFVKVDDNGWKFWESPKITVVRYRLR